MQKIGFFYKFMVCLHGQGGGVEPVRTFFGKERSGQFFAILCGHFLWTAHNPKCCLEAEFKVKLCLKFVIFFEKISKCSAP